MEAEVKTPLDMIIDNLDDVHGQLTDLQNSYLTESNTEKYNFISNILSDLHQLTESVDEFRMNNQN